jgi:hypothetical protein
VEVEGCLLDNKGMPVNAAPLIEELKGTIHELDFEYGICQFEYKTPPTPMDSLLDLNSLFEEFIEHLDRAVQKVYKGKEMVFPVFLGANPSPQILNDDSYRLITDKPRYMKLAHWILENEPIIPKMVMEIIAAEYNKQVDVVLL